MDTLKAQLQKPRILGTVALLAGLLIGWLVIGWGLWPVQYVDGNPSQLAAYYQQDYLRAASDSYALTRDADAARGRMESLGAGGDSALATARAGASGEELARLQGFEAASRGPSAPGVTPAPTEQPAAGAGWLGILLPLCGVLLLLVVVVGGGYLVWRQLKKPAVKSMPASQAAAQSARRVSESTPRTDLSQEPTPTGAEPVAQFMTTYMLGDDLYDDSFSIDAPSGDFLGECGVGLSETIGVGDPKKVTAFEVWLFDKNDIRTVTRVLMSEHAFRDETLRTRLAAKGEPVQAVAGQTVTMETASLVVTARVVDLAYGGGALPPNSFFERITIELAAYPRPKAAVEA